MKKQFNGSFEYSGIEYDYSAVIYSGDDSYIYPDRITDLDRSDGQPLDERIWEDIEFIAQQNAYLVEWCEKEKWEEEDAGGGCPALMKSEDKGMVMRIIRANESGAPLTMGEPVRISRYNRNNQLLGEMQLFKGGINEWIADPAISRWTPYSDQIRKIAAELGRPNVNPRWIEAFMSLEYPSLNSVSKETFKREVALAIQCVDAVGPEKAEQCALSFGL